MSVERALLGVAPVWMGYRLRRWTRAQRVRAALAAFEAALARLGPGDICIDCGANVGDFTARMLATGAETHAFEPDPDAHAALRDRLGGFGNLRLRNAAVGLEDGCAALHFARRRDADALNASTTSSLLTESKRVDPERSVDVELVDFPKFLAALPRPPALLKIDIEGAEVALLEALRARGALAALGAVFVETHEKQTPSLRRRTFDLIAGGAAYPNVNFDWR